MEEKVFFENAGITVTNSRFIVHGQTFAMSGVTSVQASKKDPSRVGPIILGIIGVGLLVKPPYIGVLLIGLAVYWWTRQRPELSVVLRTSAGETRALTNKDAAFIDSVISALNDAIVHRG